EEHSCGCPFGSPRIAGVWRLQSSRSGPNGQPPERPQLKSPVHRGEHGAAVNTIAQGMSDVSAEPVVTPPAFFVAGGPWVRPAPGIPCALFILEGQLRCMARAF